jgi:hypothetical protein
MSIALFLALAFGSIDPRQAVRQLQASLLTRDSATLALDDWCHARGMLSPGGKLVADRVHDIDKPATAAIRRRLRVSADEPIRYRRVRLRCGPTVMSEADNWYVPARLTPSMNAALDASDVPFGRVVQPLHFRRRTLSTRVLKPGQSAIIENKGLLSTPDGAPFSFVVETYLRGALALASVPTG